jgi:O-antigen ligase
LIQKKKSLFLIILYAVGIGLGIVNLLLGASRGPFIVFVLLLLLVIYYYITHEQNKLRLSMRIISVSIIGFILVSRYVIPFISKTEIFLFSRLEAFFEGRGKGRKEVRDYAFEGAWNDFLSSPIIGRQYVGTYDNFYPHNIPLEVLMATGVIGFVIFSLILMIYLFSFIRLIGKEKESSIFIILIVGATSFLAGLTSGSIFFTPNFWIFILVSILTVTDNESRNPY